jgi:hypothetical protein
MHAREEQPFSVSILMPGTGRDTPPTRLHATQETPGCLPRGQDDTADSALSGNQAVFAKQACGCRAYKGPATRTCHEGEPTPALDNSVHVHIATQQQSEDIMPGTCWLHAAKLHKLAHHQAIGTPRGFRSGNLGRGQHMQSDSTAPVAKHLHSCRAIAPHDVVCALTEVKHVARRFVHKWARIRSSAPQLYSHWY